MSIKMVTAFMISRFRWPVRLALFTLSVVPMVACERVPLLAPSGSTLTLTSPTTALPVNGTAPIGVQVIEPSGTPPHSGTHVTFTTTLGTLFPTEAETDSSGQAIVQFRAGTASGTATISAISGGASVGCDRRRSRSSSERRPWAGSVINASPSLVPSLGGSSTISAQVLRRERQRAGRCARVVLDDRGNVELDACRHRREWGRAGRPERRRRRRS